MISVYRIYYARSWRMSGQLGELVKLFDGVPEFLHSGCALPEGGPEVGATDAVARQAAIKIAMAQCHVALVWGGDSDPAAAWTQHEVRVAQAAFRRKIPILALVPQGHQRGAAIAGLADRTVDWSPVEVARAVMELAEDATEKRHLGWDGAALARGPGAGDVKPRSGSIAKPGEPRPLPVDEIIIAYHRLKSSRPLGFGADESA